MFSSSENDASSSNSDNFISIASNEEILEYMDEKDMVIFDCMVVPYNSHELFTSREIEEGARQSINPMVGVRDVLSKMWATPNLFKTLTNFTWQNLMN
jgi:hypothetical protein